MKFQTEQPTRGQFVAVWTYDDKVWSDTYAWIGGKLHIYCDVSDEFKRETKTFVDDITFFYITEV